MDANPLNKSLPSEVVLRRRPQVKKSDVKQIDEVEVDLRAALSLKPEARIKWLTKACEMAKDGRTSSNELFDIISSRRFTAALPFKVGRKMCSIAHEYAHLFSDRQQRYMYSQEWVLNSKYGADKEEVRDNEDKGDDDNGEPPRRERRDKREVDDESPKRRSSKYDYGEEDVGRQRRVPKSGKNDDEELARREALERRLAAQEEERRLKREERKRQAAVEEMEDFTTRLLGKPQTTKQQLEEEVDSSLQMLENLSQRQQPEDPESGRHRRRGRASRSRSASPLAAETRRRRQRRRARSRSRSISVQAATPSPSPPNSRRPLRDDRGSGGKLSFEEALRRKLAQREASDSTRIPVTWTREDMRRGRHLQNRSKWAASGHAIP